MRTFFIALLLVAPVVADGRFERFDRDLAKVRDELRISKLSAVILENGQTVWGRDDGGKEGTQPGSGEFSQTYSGERIVCNFSQSGDSSSLRVEVPERNLTFIARANSKAMTEAAHLEDGNIARSAVALAFLEDIVFERAFERDEMENRALLAFYFGRRNESAAILREALDKYPELESIDDVTLLRLLSDLHLPATEGVATVVLKEHPDLPAAWLYYGRYLRSEKRFREATLCFKQITEHQPPWHNWTVSEAKKELSTLE